MLVGILSCKRLCCQTDEDIDIISNEQDGKHQGLYAQNTEF